MQPPLRVWLGMLASVHAPSSTSLAEPSLAQPSPSEPLPSEPSPSESSEDAPSDDTLAEVVVDASREERPKPASGFTRSEARELPGALGDPFRALEALPGVTPVSSAFPFPYVRGAPPGNVGYFLDDLRVPYLYHVGVGPSVVHPGVLSRVDLYPGAYPARYGRFAGAIVAAESAEPRADFHGEANLRLFDAGALLETGFGGERGTLLLAGRYSYTAALVSLLAPDTKLDYRDYQARITYQLSPFDRLSLFGFGSYDLLGAVTDDQLTVLSGTEFHRASLRYDRASDDGALRASLTFGYDRTSAGFIAGDTRDVIDRSAVARLDIERRVGERVRVRAGADVALDAYSAPPPRYGDIEHPARRRFDDLFPTRTDLCAGVWLDLVVRATRDLEIIPGLRSDLWRSRSSTRTGLDPRLSSRLTVAPGIALVQTFGIAHQGPAFVVPSPALVPASLDDGLQRGVAGSLGIELEREGIGAARATVYYSKFDNATDAIGVATSSGPLTRFDQRSDGYAYGGELSIERRLTWRVGGFASYTVSRSMRRVGRELFPSATDRRHVATGALALDLGRGWRAALRVGAYSGSPVLASGGEPSEPRPTTVRRGPAFSRLDLRFEKRWRWDSATWLSLVVELLNATFGEERYGAADAGRFFVPNVGLEAGF